MHTHRFYQQAMTLVELMVALALGLLITSAALFMHARSSAVYRELQTIARLQEVARVALQTIESDLRMANHWGFHNRAALIWNRGTAGTPLPAPFTAEQQSRIDLCGGAGSRWALRLDEFVDGSNDGFGLACPAVGTPVTGSDTLVVRRAAASAPAAMAADRIHVQTTRTKGELFVATSGCSNPQNPACVPPTYDPSSSRTHELVVHAYYVSTGSTQNPDAPALRRKSFGNVNAALPKDAISDVELASGVEDLQVLFGVDTDHNGDVDEYSNPGSVAPGAAVLSVTVWLRVRAEDPETGYVDRTAYRYGSMSAAWTPDDNFRRLVATRTVQLRNSSQ